MPERAHAPVGVAFGAVVAVAIAQGARDRDHGQRLAAGLAALVDRDEQQRVVLDGSHRVVLLTEPAQKCRVAFVGLVDVRHCGIAQAGRNARRQLFWKAITSMMAPRVVL